MKTNQNKTNVTPEKDVMTSANQTHGGYKLTPLVASQQGRANQHEPACFGLSSPWSFPSRSSNPTIGGGRGWALYVPFIGGGAIKRSPPGDVFLLTPTGMSLVWGKLVHPLTGYSIPPPKGALLVTPPMQWGIYFDHSLPPPYRWIARSGIPLHAVFQPWLSLQ